MTTDIKALVPDETVAAFRRDGAVVLRGVFGADWLDMLARGIERNLAAPGPMATEPPRVFRRPFAPLDSVDGSA